MGDIREDNAQDGTLSPVKGAVTKGQTVVSRTLSWLLRWGIPSGILAVLGYVLFSRLSFTELTKILSQSAPEWLLLGLLFYALTNIVRALRIACLLRWPYSRTPRLVPIMFALSLFNNVLPMRTGEFSFPYLMQRYGIEWGYSLATLLVARLFDLLVVCLLFLLTAATQFSLLPPSAEAFIAGAAVALALLLVLLLALPVLGRRLLPFLQTRLSRDDLPPSGWRVLILQQTEKALNALEVMRPRRVYWPALFYSILIWLGTYTWFACYLRGIGLPTGLGRVILGASFAVLSKSLPIGSIGGLGAHEAGWTLGFTLLGQRVSIAILSGFAVNMLTLLSSVIFGLGSLGWLAVLDGRTLLSYLPRAEQKQKAVRRDGVLTQRPLMRHWKLVLILVLFIALGTLYSVITPLFETPDEVWHYLYVKHIADGKGLPVYHEGVTFPMRQEASQPPLYYLMNGWATAWIDTSDVEKVVQYNPHAAIGAPAAWGNRNVISHTPYEDFPYHGTVLAAHLVRFLSILMGAGTIWCTYAIAHRLFPQPSWLAPAAAALNAFNPQFIFISASINNDVLATLLAALSLWLLVCIVQDGPAVWRLGVLGVVLGLAALTKLNGLVLVPLTALVRIVLAWRRGSKWAVIPWGAWLSVVALATGGWWYLRNWLLYRDPLGLQLMFAVLPARTQRPTFAELLRLFDGVVKSFWGVFGWFNVVMEPGVYTAFEVGMTLAMLGVAWFFLMRLIRRQWKELPQVGVLIVWSVAFVVALVGWSQARYPQGRLLFPAMPAIATLLAFGFAQWLPARYARWFISVMVTVLVIFAAVVPYRYIAPAYARAQPLTAAEREAIAHPLSVEFGNQVRLLGYELSDDIVRPGERLWLVLYWEAMAAMDKDYSVFVHLVDDRSVTITQRDSYPGAGNDPTRSWRAGQCIQDTYPLDVPVTLLAEGPCRIRVGLYDYATMQRLPVYKAGRKTTDFVELPVELELESQPFTKLNELYYDFEGLIALTGYAVEPIVAQPGDTLQMILRWQALQTLHEDYTVFVHLMRSDAQIWAQNDHVPRNGQSPTSTWLEGQVVTDRFELHISPDAPVDRYELLVGLYESKTIKRLKLSNGLDFVVLGKIDVQQ